MLRLAVLAVLVVAAAQAAASVRAPAPAWLEPQPEEGDEYEYDYGGGFAFEEPSQEPDAFESIVINMDPRTHIPAAVPAHLAQRNLAACLAAIKWAEGTAGPDGYRTMFGYRYFNDFSDHPRQYFPYTNEAGVTIRTSAAGAYQIIVRTWDSLRARLNLPDFSPASQDAAAVELIRERGALQDAYAGRMEAVATKCRSVWASLPGSDVDQPTRPMSGVLAAFQSAGGTLA